MDEAAFALREKKQREKRRNEVTERLLPNVVLSTEQGGDLHQVIQHACAQLCHSTIKSMLRQSMLKGKRGVHPSLYVSTLQAFDPAHEMAALLTWVMARYQLLSRRGSEAAIQVA
ncbi:hypothetical protein Scep_023540 [Stephania cephalantha]|uniref:Uncharacterized protein n=1 Tax=Stephania cephalantha TaxID=152367 RepID=A0AAP0HXL3_9MAGN